MTASLLAARISLDKHLRMSKRRRDRGLKRPGFYEWLWRYDFLVAATP